MNAFNVNPLFRTAIGFDRLVRLVDAAATSAEVTYPPYNIEKTGEDSYQLTMAVAGFGPDDIELVARENTLVISGKVAAEAPKAEVLYRGIAGRAFERKFTLADHIVVEGRGPDQRPAACRAQARRAGGAEAPPHRRDRRVTAHCGQ